MVGEQYLVLGKEELKRHLGESIAVHVLGKLHDATPKVVKV